MSMSNYIAVIHRNDFSHEVTRPFASREKAEWEAKRRIEVLVQEHAPDPSGRPNHGFHYRVHQLPAVPDNEQTQRLNDAITRAREIANEAGHRSVGTQHMLLAILGHETLATQALACMGVFIKWSELHKHVMNLTNPEV